MKKSYFLYALTIIIFIFFVTLPMSIGEVQAYDINYTISYDTQIIGSAQIKCEGDLNPIPLKNYMKSFNVDITDSTIVKAIENYKKESLKQINETTPNAMVSDRTFIDGYVYPIPPENAKYFFRFFELPTNFTGTKVISKDGIPFSVTGDGQGNLSMTILSDFTGQKNKTFIIPEEKTHTIKEEMVSRDYYVFYWIPNSATEFMPNGNSASYNAKTLEEALEHCAQNADLEKSIRISVIQTYRIDIEATASRKVILNTTYGNSPKNSSDSSTNSTAQKAPTTQDTSSTSKEPTNKTTVDASQNTEQSNEDVSAGKETQTPNNETLTEDIKITNTILEEKTDENTNKKAPLKYIILFCIISVIALGVFGVLHIRKKGNKKGN